MVNNLQKSQVDIKELLCLRLGTTWKGLVGAWLRMRRSVKGTGVSYKKYAAVLKMRSSKCPEMPSVMKASGNLAD